MSLPSASRVLIHSDGEGDATVIELTEPHFVTRVASLHGPQYSIEWFHDQAKTLFNSQDYVPLPLDDQGLQSYSLIMDGKDIVQFRLPRISMELMRRILRDSYSLFPEWVPKTDVYDCPPFVVHRSPLLEGASYSQFLSSAEDMYVGVISRVQTVATVLGRATAVGVPTTKDSLTAIDAHLATITHPALTEYLSAIRTALPNLTLLPTVLTHMDLNLPNMLLDKTTGALTGIVDWVDAMYLPFGAGLYAFDSLTGHEDAQGWHWNADKERLENIFWETLWACAAPDLASRKDSKEVQEGIAVA